MMLPYIMVKTMNIDVCVSKMKKKVLAALMPFKFGWQPVRSAFEADESNEFLVSSLDETLSSFGLKTLAHNSRFVYTKNNYVFKFEPVPYQNTIEANFHANNPRSFYLHGLKITFPKFIGSYWDGRLVVTRMVKDTGKYPDAEMEEALARVMEERFGIGDVYADNVVWQKSQAVVIDCGYDKDALW